MSEEIKKSLRKRRDEWLLELKLELQRILRDNGKCLNFGSFGKTTWMDFPAREDIALVFQAGDVIWCWKVNNTPQLLPGKSPSVFDPSQGIPIPLLLDFVEMYPKNPFED